MLVYHSLLFFKSSSITITFSIFLKNVTSVDEKGKNRSMKWPTILIGPRVEACINPFCTDQPTTGSPAHYPRKIRSKWKCKIFHLVITRKNWTNRLLFSARQEQGSRRRTSSRIFEVKWRAKQCPACFLVVHLSPAVFAPPSPPVSPEAPLDLLTVAFSASPWSFHGFSESLELLSWRRCLVSFITCLNFLYSTWFQLFVRIFLCWMSRVLLLLWR